ncbi:hypothetical protein HF086_003614 [Spodoptera exigua]|uniref:Uncharacterized protein n=1 Tax=Spodoptera exigua TaxID=7107 RepID=A0A922SJ45_SPOEX|nr:hypothetical protein HF086_003614 [Spodoptera exigua]
MENSPFAQSSRVARSPPGTPLPPATPTSQRPCQFPDLPETIQTPEIQKWLTVIDQSLTEVCSIVGDGKMNSEQKLRVNALSRKVSSATAQMAVLYQALKCKAMLDHQSLCNLTDQLDLSHQIQDLKQKITDTPKPTQSNSFADMVKKGANKFIQPINVSSIAIYPNDKMKTSDETKSLVQKIICPEEMKLQMSTKKEIHV